MRSPRNPVPHLTVAATVLSLVLTACTGGGGSTSPSTAPSSAASESTGAAKPAIMLTDFLLFGWHAPLFAGKAEGLFSDEGIDLTIQSGKGSADGATKISAGAAQFGQIDAISALTAMTKGADLKLVGIYFAKHPGGMCYIKERHTISSYKDMEGLKIGAAAGDAYMVALPGLMKDHGADSTKYQVITMDGANTTPALVSGQIDATPCGLPTFPDRQAAAAKQNLNASFFSFADNGFGAVGFALVTSGKLISSDPELVQHAVNAWAMSSVWSFANPDKAVADFTSANPTLNAASAKQSFDGVIPLIKGPNGYFVFDKPSLQKTVDFVNQAYQGSLKIDDVYTSQFVDKLPDAVKQGKLP